MKGPNKPHVLTSKPWLIFSTCSSPVHTYMFTGMLERQNPYNNRKHRLTKCAHITNRSMTAGLSPHRKINKKNGKYGVCRRQNLFCLLDITPTWLCTVAFICLYSIYSGDSAMYWFVILHVRSNTDFQISINLRCHTTLLVCFSLSLLSKFMFFFYNLFCICSCN